MNFYPNPSSITSQKPFSCTIQAKSLAKNSFFESRSQHGHTVANFNSQFTKMPVSELCYTYNQSWWQNWIKFVLHPT